jgi:hypothetical protein
MGKAILYCYKCSTLLREDDFAKGKAVHSGDHVACAGCAPEIEPAAPPSPAKKNITSTRIPAHRPGSGTSIQRPVQPDPPPADRKLLLISGSAAALLIVAVIAVVASGGKSSGPPEKAAAPPPESAAPRSAPEQPERKALQAARKWAKDHPQDLAGQMTEYQSVVFDWSKTPSGEEAKKELARLKAEVRGYVDAALATLEGEINAPLQRQDYAAAIKILEGAARRLPYPEWELARSKRESEIRDLSRSKPAPPPLAADPDLVGHWTFDEGAGSDAKDSSGNNHTGKLKGGAAWAPGKIGSGLLCDGKGAYVQLPNSPLLDRLQSESFSLAAWYRPDVVPAGGAEASDSAHGIIVKQGWHEGLVFSREGRFLMEHWLTGNVNAGGGTWSDAYAPGQFYHVASVVNRAAGKTQVYVNGVQKGSSDWTSGAATRAFETVPWRIGIGNPGAQKYAYPAKGVIDEVRMYKRALGAEEILSLYESGR